MALVDAYLAEIAKGYGVAWTPNKADGGDGEGGVKVSDYTDLFRD